VHTPVGDAASYDAWARRIATGDWLGTETFYQAPAYPYFVALVYRTLGAEPMTIRKVQALLGAAACLFLGLAGCSFFNRRTGIVAATILAIYPPAIFFTGLIQKTTLTLALLCFLLWALASAQRTPRAALMFASGLLLALLALVRENALILAFIISAWIFLGLRIHAARQRGFWICCFLAGLSVPLGLVAWRNHHVGNVWAVTTTQAGPNFWIGNNPDATGMYVPLIPGREMPAYERADARRLASEALGRELDDGEVSAYWMDRALDYIRAHPWQWTLLLGRKFLLAVNRYEIDDTEGYRVYRGYAWMLEILATLLHFGVIVPLAVAGVALTWAQRRNLALVYAIFLALLSSIVLFYVFGRYRFPLVPPAILFTAAALVEAYGRWKQRERRGVAPAVTALGLAAILSNYPVVDEGRLDNLMFENVALLLGKQGNWSGAGQVLDIALESAPDVVELHFDRAIVFRFSGEPRAALEHLQEAQRLNSDVVGMAVEFALCYEALGEIEAARTWFNKALTENPNDRDAQAGLERLRPHP
jgi:4-amino-4-deoxy-L-arabinose transferase-like glycosyltransferase